MKVNEILNEQHGGIGSLQPGVARALPNALGFPSLPNQDPYLQYRFGLAMAAALAEKNGDVDFDVESAFGEDLTVIARSEAEEEIVRLAQQLDPRARSTRQVSTRASEEASDVNKQSPMKPQGPVRRKSK